MKINFKATNLTLTPAILDYCREKLGHLDKFLVDDENVFTEVEVGKTTRHHKHGEVFRAEINLHLAGHRLRAEATTEDLYAAVDEAKDELVSEVKRYRKRQGTLIRRGGRLVKDFLHGVYNYQWRKH
ncbi:MAG: ribosome-associated translation inhibitor RaiA [Patescibacteria group bacterium]